jgi:long-subunit acyl-CoA synthetase (AMP-forming)
MVVTEKPQSKEAVVYKSRRSDNVAELPPNQDTLPKAFLASVRKYGDLVAMRKKRFGIWQEYTWNDCYDHVRHFCLGLVSMGLQRGDKIAIIGENDPEFYWAEIAAHSTGAITSAIFTDANLQELAYVVTNSDSVSCWRTIRNNAIKPWPSASRFPPSARSSTGKSAACGITTIPG